MLPRPYRLPLPKTGRFSGSVKRYPTLNLISQPNQLSHSRLSVIIPKSAVKLSSQRHRLTRQLHGLFLRELTNIPPLDLLLIIKSNLPEQILSDFRAFLTVLPNTNH